MTQHVLIVDGNNMVSRFYHAIPPLTDPRGELVHAVHGLACFIPKVRGILQLNHEPVCVVAFDSKLDPNSLHECLRANYKANREEKPPDWHRQMDQCAEVCRLAGWQVMKKDGVEADDLIAGAAEYLSEKDCLVSVLTSDKDLYQLTGGNVTMLRPNHQGGGYIHFDAAAVKNKWGVEPKLIAQWLALVGDSSDNLPGVPKIGEKTATNLLNTHGNIFKIIQDLPPTHRHRMAIEANLQTVVEVVKLASYGKERRKALAELPECKVALTSPNELADWRGLLAYLNNLNLKTAVGGFSEMISDQL
jgi:DNA polymerase-1